MISLTVISVSLSTYEKTTSASQRPTWPYCTLACLKGQMTIMQKLQLQMDTHLMTYFPDNLSKLTPETFNYFRF